MYSHMQLLPLHRVRQLLICVVPDVILPVITTPVDAFTDTHPLTDIPKLLAEHARAFVPVAAAYNGCHSSVRSSILSTIPSRSSPFSSSGVCFITYLTSTTTQSCHHLSRVALTTIENHFTSAELNCKVSLPQQSCCYIRPHHLRSVGVRVLPPFTPRTQLHTPTRDCATCVVCWD